MKNAKGVALVFVIISLIVTSLTIAMPNKATAQQTSSMNAIDNLFLMEVSLNNIAEVQLAQLALQQSSNQDVRNFAQQMISSHTTSQTQLAQLASNQSIQVSSCMSDVSTPLLTLTGQQGNTNFDRNYIRGQVLSHQKALDTFRRVIANGSNSDVRTFATTNLPDIQQHLKLARNLQRSLKQDNSSNP